MSDIRLKIELNTQAPIHTTPPPAQAPKTEPAPKVAATDEMIRNLLKFLYDETLRRGAAPFLKFFEEPAVKMAPAESLNKSLAEENPHLTPTLKLLLGLMAFNSDDHDTRLHGLEEIGKSMQLLLNGSE